jgi:hypothetical protein
MRTTSLLLVAFILFVNGCATSDREPADSLKRTEVGEIQEETTQGGSKGVARPEKPEAALSSSAARYADSTRRFLRTGDIRFRTADVVRTTFRIEELIAKHGGYVAETRLRSEVDRRYTTPISADSVLETTKYRVINQLTVRIPAMALDTTLKSLISYVDFLDHRTLSATDVRLMLLRDRLARTRIAKHESRLTKAIDEQGNKLKDAAQAEAQLLDRQEQADETTLNTLDLEDRIAYSTLTLDIYDRERTQRTVLPNDANIEAYEPGFGTKALDALQTGWSLLLQLALLLMRSWSVILLALVSFFLYRKYRARK